MARLTTVSKLLPVDIGMAVRALRSDVPELELQMAAGAGDVLVQSSQREGCFSIVIELRNRTNGLPAHGRVTVLARDAESAVRIARARGSAPLCLKKGTASTHQQQYCQSPGDDSLAALPRSSPATIRFEPH
jgi:hypothetical protein